VSGLTVIPKSHLLEPGALPHEPAEDAALPLGVAQAQLDQLPAPVALELRAGSVSVHHCQLLHGSDANRSNRRRAGVALHYMAAGSLFNRSASRPGSEGFGYGERPLFWVRGDALHPENTIVRDVRPETARGKHSASL